MNGDINLPRRSRGSLIGSIIIVLVLLAGAIYLFSSRRAQGPTPPPPAGETRQPSNGSDELSDLEAAAGAIEFQNLDADLP